MRTPSNRVSGPERGVRTLLLGVAAALPLAWLACGGSDGAPAASQPDAGNLDGGGSDAGPAIVSWHEPDYPFRVSVRMLAHPKKDRTDVPLIAMLSHAGASILRDVRVHPNVDGAAAIPQAGAWQQPDGSVFEVGFKAEGLTKAGDTRDFVVYYKTAASPSPWATGATGSWSTVATSASAMTLTGGGYSLQRAMGNDGALLGGRRTDGATFLKQSAGAWTVVNGFTNQLQLESQTETWPTFQFEEGAPTLLASDSDAVSAAMAAAWQGRTAPVAHDAYLTYRVFAGFPFLESVMSVSLGAQVLALSADWSGRDLYLTDTYDRMVSDTRGEEALAKIWDTSMRWLVVFDSASHKGFGWYLFHQGVVRADGAAGDQSIYDSYGYSAGGSNALRYLWMASSSKDDIVTLFDAMQPGVAVGDPERKELNIVAPRATDYFFPGDTLDVLISTPGNTQPVTATVELPGGSKVPIELVRDTNPLLWHAVSPRVFASADPSGQWKLAAQSAGVDAASTFEFRIPSHPRLYFSAAEVPALKARKDQAAYAGIWADMLSRAKSYDPPIPDPGPGKDIRGYADRLMNLALIQLVDPSQPYDELLWSYFFTMLRYPNWDSSDVPFNNLDLTVGHFLTALAVVYDWHYDKLTPDERKELRARLLGVTETWVTTSYLATHRNIDWPDYGTETNNHTWINHEGVAAAAFVLADEMPDAQREPWVARIEENLGIILSVLEDDGSSNEGVAYHSYGQINLFPWLDMRDRALGGNTAASSPWFKQSVLWDLYSILPGGDDNYGGVANFGDCPPYHYNPPRTIQAWLASRLGDGLAQWSAQSLDWPSTTQMSYLWFDPSVTPTSPDTLPPFRLFDKKGIFVSRSSWANDATYFSVKSGSYYGGHEQPDAGHFILHRAGVPYVTDQGYSYLKKTDEHNLVVFDDTDQFGGGVQWMSAVDPQHWAKVDSSLAEARTFDVVTDPAPMQQIADLQSWKRELVGLQPDIFFVRDAIAAGSQHTLSWLLHSYKSAPPTSASGTYEFLSTRTENPWTTPSAAHWVTQPRAAAPSLHVGDVSASAWTAVIEPSSYVPELNLDTHAYNEGKDSFQLGYRLRRTIQADQASSVVALWFGDDMTLESWTSGATEAARLVRGGASVAVVIWPAAGQVTGLHGFDATAQMAGRRYDAQAVFGRSVTKLSEGTTTLVDASSAVDVLSRLEHDFSASDPGVVVVHAAAQATLQVRCAKQPTSTTMDGTAVTPTYSNSLLTLTVPSGEHRFEMH